MIESGSSLKPFNIAHASSSAVVASLMGATHYSAPDDAIGGSRGFLKNFASDSSRLHFEHEYKIMGIYVKPYAACRHCHSPIDCSEMIASENCIDPMRISSVNVETYKLAVRGHDHNTVVDSADAKMSTPFGVASMLCGKGAFVDAYSEEAISDIAVVNLMKKIVVSENAEMTDESPGKRGARVTVVMDTGKSYSRRVDYPKGEPENPISDRELYGKASSLLRCAGMPDGAIELLFQEVNQPEPNLSFLIQECGKEFA